MPIDPRQFKVEGELDQYPFPRVLQFLHESNATGRLVLRRGAITKVVFMVEGAPVNVESTLRDETLGRYLVKKGLIGEDQYEQSIKMMIEQGIQQGAALVKLGYLSPKDLYHEVKAQTREKLITCFAWVGGGFAFYPEVDFVEDIYRFEMAVPSTMREGISRFFPPGAIERQLVKARPGPIIPIAGFFDHIGAYDLNQEESAFIMAIDGQKDLLGLKRLEDQYPFAVKLLYLLMVTGLIGPNGEPDPNMRDLGAFVLKMPPLEEFIQLVTKDTAPEVVESIDFTIAPSSEDTGVEKSTEVIADREDWITDRTCRTEDVASRSLEISIEEEGLEPRPEPDEPAPPWRDKAVIDDAGQFKKTYDEEDVVDEWKPEDAAAGLDEDLPDEEARPESPPPAAPAIKAPPPSQSEPPPAAAAVPAGPLRDESEILEFYMNLKHLDFFTLLGAPRDADDQLVFKRYRQMRDRFEKHTFIPELSREAQDKLEEINAQIIRAYETIRVSEGRKAYLADLKKKPAVPKIKATLRAEQYLQKGIDGVRRRDWPAAQAMFERAVEANPNDPEYLGYLAWTIFSNPKLELEDRRQRAKKLLKDAIDKNPNVDSAHVFLGKIFKDEGKPAEAVDQFEIALLCNPKCKEAERELDLHERGEW